MSHVSTLVAVPAASPVIPTAPIAASSSRSAASSSAVVVATASALSSAGQIPKAAASLDSAAKLKRWETEVNKVLKASKVDLTSFQVDKSLFKEHVIKSIYNLACCGEKLDADIAAGRFQATDKNRANVLRKSIYEMVNLLPVLCELHKCEWHKDVLHPLLYTFWGTYFSRGIGMKALPREFLKILPNPFICPSMRLLRSERALAPSFLAKLKKDVIHSVLYLQYLANKILTDHLGEHAYAEVQDRIKEYMRVATRRFSPIFLFDELIPLLEDYKKVEKEKKLRLDPDQKVAFYNLGKILAVSDSSTASPLPASTSSSSAMAVGPRVIVAAPLLASRTTPSSDPRVERTGEKNFKTSAKEGSHDKARGEPIASGVSASAGEKPAVVDPSKTPEEEFIKAERDFGKIKIPEDARDVMRQDLITQMYDLGLIIYVLQNLIKEESSQAMVKKAGELLERVKPKMWQLLELSMKYAGLYEPLLVEEVLFPLMESFSCFPLDRQLIQPTSPLPLPFLKNLSDPLRLQFSLSSEIESRKNTIIYDVYDLVCIRDKIRKLDLQVESHRNAYKEINLRIAKYMDFASNISPGFLLRTVIPLVSGLPMENGLQLISIPEDNLSEWVRNLQGAAATTSSAT